MQFAAPQPCLCGVNTNLSGTAADATGRFSYQTQVSPPYQYFQAFARLPGRTYPASLCQPSILPYTCVGISTTRDTAQSNVVRVVAKS